MGWTETDLLKLPKWAREALTGERMRRQEAEAKLEALFPNASTNTFWRDGLTRRSLPNNSLLSFRVGGGDLDIIQVFIMEQGLRISSRRSLAIYPMTCNVVIAKLEKQAR